ncbi:MAG TPA: CrcB family protein [Niallia sp.]|nr:CrcB family protein [Niallia sp.]
MFKTLFFIAFGGFLGATCRFLIINYLKGKWNKSFLPTIIVNISGSFILGVLAETVGSSIYTFLGIGFLGAYTTFSTLVVEACKLYKLRRKKDCVIYLVASFIGGIIFCLIGVLVGKLIH